MAVLVVVLLLVAALVVVLLLAAVLVVVLPVVAVLVVVLLLVAVLVVVLVASTAPTNLLDLGHDPQVLVNKRSLTWQKRFGKNFRRFQP